MPKLPESIGKYKIVNRLGRGGMGLVYKAVHPTLGIPVVIKKLTLRGSSNYRERFRREASLMMKIRHENVVGVYDHFREGSAYYLVMEYVDGCSLYEILATGDPLPSEDAGWLAFRIAKALSVVHSMGIIHRDVKPSNILLGKDGSVKLADFGIALSVNGNEKNLTSENSAVGTPSYMPPEQFSGSGKIDERSDMWSFGVTLFEMLTGNKFISADSPEAMKNKIASAVRTRIRRIPPGTPSPLKKIIRRTLILKKERRLKNGSEAVSILKIYDNPFQPSLLRFRIAALLGLDYLPEKEESGEQQEDNKKIFFPRNLMRNKKISIPLISAIVFLLVFISVPGIWPSLFQRDAYGKLVLQLEIPSGVPEVWLKSVKAELYRDNPESSLPVTSVSLNKSGNGNFLSSRSLYLPSGGYRIKWLLGNRISYSSVYLKPLNEITDGSSDGGTVKEKLGLPPVIKLNVRWRAENAVTGESLNRETVMSWKRLDNQGTALESGGKYKFIFKSEGFRDSVYYADTDPWIDNISIKALLWPLPGVIAVTNNSEKTVKIRINGKDSYLDISGDSPEIRKIRRLKEGNKINFFIVPEKIILSVDTSGNSGDVIQLTPEAGRKIFLEINESPDGITLCSGCQ